MITYTCDQCGSPLGGQLRITATHSAGDDHFCSVICLSGWAVKNGHRGAPTPRGHVRTPREHRPETPKMPRPQDSTQRTCEVCGREGTRRYVQTATGWRCSPSATRCPGNQAELAENMPEDIPAKPLTSESDICAKEFPANVTPAEENPLPRARELVGQLVDGVADKILTAPPARVDDSPEPASETCPKPEPPQVKAPAPVDQSAPRNAGRGPQPVTAKCRDCGRPWTITGRALENAVALHEHQRGHVVDVEDQEPANA